MTHPKDSDAPVEEEGKSRRSFLETTARAGLGLALVGGTGACASVHGQRRREDEENELEAFERLADESTFREGEPTISMRTVELRQYVSTVESCAPASNVSLSARKSRRVLQLQKETIMALNSWDGERFEVNARFTSIFGCKKGCGSRLDTCCPF